LLSLLFIELIGINGVAYAVLVSDGMLLLLYYYSVNRFVFKKAV